LKILLDMNLSPEWVPFLEQAGFSCVHWSAIGNPRATDAELMAWARVHDHVIFTHDMDFGALLAATRAVGPSVLQARVKSLTPGSLGQDIIRVLYLRRDALERGAIITIDKLNSRVRVLPIGFGKSGSGDPG